MAKTPAETILAHLKGLRAQMREGEQPLFSVPAIWENAVEHQSKACDLVLTNRRLFGYISITFPRERLFLDALELDNITSVSVRQKNFEALFRELLVSDGQKRVYIRATRRKIEDTYTALREAIAEHAPDAHAALSTGEQDDEQTRLAGGPERQRREPTYNQVQIRQPLERSPLGITLLLVGGLLLEIVGVLAWAATSSAQIGLPLCLAGVVAVIVATLARRQVR